MTRATLSNLHQLGVRRVEIPIIQRDFAQGRRQPDVDRIRNAFLEVLRGAVVGPKSVHVDFIYGHIEGDKLIPLDGQQRLTTLFLMHWYVAARAGLPASELSRLPALTYETRRTSREFCELLVGQRPFPLESRATLSGWFRDQSWFTSAWERDPTVASMLTILDTFHGLFASDDCALAWERLVDTKQPAVTFDFLAIDKLGFTDDLYIKMNSRGKPLTEFETFKAEFEAMVREHAPARYSSLATKVDTEWTDIFWKIRDGWRSVDDMFIRYFRFITDAVALGSGAKREGDDLERARAAYVGNDAALDVLFSAFDVWVNQDVRGIFEKFFVRSGHATGKVPLFDEIDLLRACCTTYDRGQLFSIGRQLVLWAVIAHLRSGSPEFSTRVRVLRNLIRNSSNEMRSADLPTLFPEVTALVTSGALPSKGVNRKQVAEEIQKAGMVQADASLGDVLRRLEDHPLFQGSLAAFDLNATTELARRASVFEEIFPVTTALPHELAYGALLASGDYSQFNELGRHQFGVPRTITWRSLLTRGAPATNAALEKLLDSVGAPKRGPIADRLRTVIDDYIASCDAKLQFDWRYYFVKYPEMRTGLSGMYASATKTMGFVLVMLDKERLSSKYRDPFLYAVYSRSSAGPDSRVKDQTFRGPLTIERWMDLGPSGVGVRSVQDGWHVRPPTDRAFADAFDVVAKAHQLTNAMTLPVSGSVISGTRYDSEDRVARGVSFVDAILAMQPAGAPAPSA